MRRSKRFSEGTVWSAWSEPGGAGKTRLAVQVGFGLVGSYADGVWMVDLAPLRDPALVADRLAIVLGVRGEHGQPMEDSLAEACSEKEMLLLFDN